MISHPKHLADLQKSGLTDATIALAKIESIRPDRIDKELGFRVPNLESVYRIPYDDKFSRFRCFYFEGADGQKYLQRRNTGTALHQNSVIFQDLQNQSISEGACQGGLFCIVYKLGLEECSSDSFRHFRLFISRSNRQRIPAMMAVAKQTRGKKNLGGLSSCR